MTRHAFNVYRGNMKKKYYLIESFTVYTLYIILQFCSDRRRIVCSFGVYLYSNIRVGLFFFTRVKILCFTKTPKNILFVIILFRHILQFSGAYRNNIRCFFFFCSFRMCVLFISKRSNKKFKTEYFLKTVIFVRSTSNLTRTPTRGGGRVASQYSRYYLVVISIATI